MKISSLFVLLFSVLCFSSAATAKDSAVQEGPVMGEVVEEYFELKELGLLESQDKHRPPNCRPQNGSCFRTACETVGRFECDDQDEMDTLRRACRGNWGDACLKTAFRYLGQFEYDDLEEMAELAHSCRGVYDSECVSYTCERMGRFGCDDLEEIIEVNQRCSGSRRQF